MPIVRKIAAALIMLAALSFLSIGSFAGEVSTVSVYFLRSGEAGAQAEAVAVSRQIPRTKGVLKRALIELFKGPTEQERRKGLSAFFSPESVADYNTECQEKRDRKTLKPLGAYFLGATILQDGTAVVDFRPDAMCYLENTPANASLVKEPIEKTARQFPSVKGVEYSIDGKRITGWDA